MNFDEKIYLDHKGYDKLLLEIRLLNKKLKQIRSSKVAEGQFNYSVSKEDNSNEFALTSMLEMKMDILNRAVIVERAADEGTIDINDCVKLSLSYNQEEETETIVKLIGSASPDILAEVSEISLNSPLGKAIYGKTVGDEVSYKTSDGFCRGRIVEKI